MNIKQIRTFNITFKYNKKVYNINDELVAINVNMLINELEDYITDNNLSKHNISNDIVNEIIFLTQEYVNNIYDVNKLIMENKQRQYIDAELYSCINKKPDIIKLYNDVMSGNYEFKHKK